jgi:hypothetical protein
MRSEEFRKGPRSPSPQFGERRAPVPVVEEHYRLVLISGLNWDQRAA